MIDPLAVWRELPATQREAIEAQLRRHGPDIEVFAAIREGDEVAVHGVRYTSNLVPQQVGADLIDHTVTVLIAMGGRVTMARSTNESVDERLDFDAPAAIAALKQRTLEALFGPERSPEEDAMLAAIDAAPDDDGPRTIYADWLQERGDPRGEFIAMQLTGKPVQHLANAYLKGVPWRDGEATVFERGFAKILAVSNTWDFVREIDFYARMRPLPEQFICAENSRLLAFITRDRRRFVMARTFISKPKKRDSDGSWDITVGRCADRSTLFTTTLPWSWNQQTLTNELSRIELVDDAIKLRFASGERSKRIKIVTP